MAIRRHRSKKGFNTERHDSVGLVTYGRWVDRSKGKFARKMQRRNRRK